MHLAATLCLLVESIRWACEWSYRGLVWCANSVESPHQCVPSFSQPVEIYVNFIRNLLQFSKDLPHPLTKFHCPPPIPSCPKSVRSWWERIPLIVPKTECRIDIDIGIQPCAVTVDELQFQNKVAIMPANNPLGILELIVRLSGRGLSQRSISMSTGVSKGGISKVLRRVRETERAIHRPHGHRLWMTTPREARALIRIMNRNRYLSSSRIRVELIRRTGPRVSVRTVQRCLIAAGYHSRRPARCPRLTYDHRQRRRVWARWHRNWNHQHWSHVIFADESRFSLYHCDGRARVRRHVGERRVDCCI